MGVVTEDLDPPLAMLTEQLQTPLLRRLLRDWGSWRRGRELPGRADFRPEDLRYVLGGVILLDVLHEPLRFRYRLIGSGLTLRRGLDLSGQLMDDHPNPEIRAVAIACNRTVVESRQPQVWHWRLPTVQGHRVAYEGVNMPLSADGRAIDMILVGQCPLETQERLHMARGTPW